MLILIQTFFSYEARPETLNIFGPIVFEAREETRSFGERVFWCSFSTTHSDDMQHCEQAMEVKFEGKVLVNCQGRFDEQREGNLDPETQFWFDLFLAVLTHYLGENQARLRGNVALFLQEENLTPLQNAFFLGLWKPALNS